MKPAFLKSLSIVSIAFCSLLGGAGVVLSMDRTLAVKVIQEYGDVLSETSSYLVADIKRLPYSKQEIKDAIKFALPLVDTAVCETLRIGYTQLGMFQNVRELKMLKIPAHFLLLSDSRLYELIEEKRNDPDWIPLQLFVISEMEALLAESPSCSG
jgi:hypothetical protein